MKRITLLILIFVLTLQFALSQNPIGHYKIDLKTKFNDKPGLKPAKHGLKKILQQQTWCDIREVGEDFAVWIKSPSRNAEILANGNKKVSFFCKLEIRKKSMFREGDLMNIRGIDFNYTIDKMELDKLGDINYIDVSQFIESILETSKSLDDASTRMALASLGGDIMSGGVSKVSRLAINNLLPLFQPYFSNGEPLEYKAEYYLVGGELLRNLKEMIVELEAPKN